MRFERHGVIRLTRYLICGRSHAHDLRLVFASFVLVLVGIAGSAGDVLSEVRGLTTLEVPQYGMVLADLEGFLLYASPLDEVGEDGTRRSSCDLACASEWHALVVTQWPNEDFTVEGNIDANLVDATLRPDGQYHISYGGYLLYRNVSDALPGQANFQGAGSNWFLVSDSAAMVMDEVATEEAVNPEELLATLMVEGREIFSQTCATCHGRQGQGDIGPALAGNFVLRETRGFVRLVLTGQSQMPPHAYLSDRELAAVTTYARNSWGNSFGVVTAEEVSSLR